MLDASPEAIENMIEIILYYSNKQEMLYVLYDHVQHTLINPVIPDEKKVFFRIILKHLLRLYGEDFFLKDRIRHQTEE